MPEFSLIAQGLAFPEAPLWSDRDDCLYFVEWQGDRVSAWREGRTHKVFQAEPGAGPSGLAQLDDGSFWVCLYSARRLDHIDPAGRVLRSIDRCQAARFAGPNDIILHSSGRLYFTDAGNFEDDWVTGRANGSVYCLDSSGDLRLVDVGLCFPNGVAASRDGQWLVVCEHRRNRLLGYQLQADGALTHRRVLFELDTHGLLPDELAYELGPDGLCVDGAGNYWIAHYGGGKLVCVSPQGRQMASIPLPHGARPTNVACHGGDLYVTEAELGVLYHIVQTHCS